MIDISKQYCTADGRKVRLFAYEIEGGKFHIMGFVCNEIDKRFELQLLNENGECRLSEKDLCSLVEVKPDEVKPRIKKTVWMNIYGGVVLVHPTKRSADARRDEGCIACVKVELDYEEGEGL